MSRESSWKMIDAEFNANTSVKPLGLFQKGAPESFLSLSLGIEADRLQKMALSRKKNCRKPWCSSQF